MQRADLRVSSQPESSMHLRTAIESDIPAIRELIPASVRGLQAADYTAEQIEGALTSVFGVDTQLIEDGTYFIVEDGEVLLGCGGWSRRQTLYGSSIHRGGSGHGAARSAALLDPSTMPARIRAFFVHPAYARRGVGTLLLVASEEAARREGFRRAEMAATLTGIPLYQKRGYRPLQRFTVPLENGASLPVVRMVKDL
jgi:GNAT superfamily N-acetyltransferase